MRGKYKRRRQAREAAVEAERRMADHVGPFRFSKADIDRVIAKWNAGKKAAMVDGVYAVAVDLATGPDVSAFTVIAKDGRTGTVHVVDAGTLPELPHP